MSIRTLHSAAAVRLALFALLPSSTSLLACTNDFGAFNDAHESGTTTTAQTLSVATTSSAIAAMSPSTAPIGTVQILEPKPTIIPIEKLALPDRTGSFDAYMQLLPKPTQNENVVLHLRLPAPRNTKLESSMLRILGDADDPVLLFRSDVLAQLGVISASPGEGFFSALLRLPESEVKLRSETEQRIVQGAKDLRKSALVFEGRTPIALSPGIALDVQGFLGGSLVPLGTCPVTVASNETTWGQSLLIRDLSVVRDPARTWDSCTGVGTPNGAWTFEHLVREMAQGSGQSAETFVQKWLETWLNDFTLNGDTVVARPQMFNQVVAPWAAASGVTASLNTVGGLRLLNLGGPLDLGKSPFRLAAIVNRLDLGRTESGSSGYGGVTTTRPLDAGELRFVFGVQNLSSCTVLPFTVIFEYGVPIVGCSSVRQWAQNWTALNGFGGFTAAYLNHLEGLTEQVVVHGAAPSKGNQNALDQIRTNEIALSAPWELREFTLTDENPAASSDLPSSGQLRPHTTAMTPNDGRFASLPDPLIDDFVSNVVLPSVPSMSTFGDCRSSFVVPWRHSGNDFRGSNALVPPSFWPASVSPVDLRQVCARHEFSLNTCNGCHQRDTNTAFLHVNPQTAPASLSIFLTGGGAGSVTLVSDSQFGAPNWPFADLQRRFDGLYATACVQCGIRTAIHPDLLLELSRIAKVVPIDPIGKIRTEFSTGPITDLAVVKELLSVREKFVALEKQTSVALEDFARQRASFVH